MPLIQAVIVLIVVGGIPWLVNSYIPMQDAGHHKENPQCSRDHCSDPLVTECSESWVPSQEFVLGGEGSGNTQNKVIKTEHDHV